MFSKAWADHHHAGGGHPCEFAWEQGGLDEGFLGWTEVLVLSACTFSEIALEP